MMWRALCFAALLHCARASLESLGSSWEAQVSGDDAHAWLVDFGPSKGRNAALGELAKAFKGSGVRVATADKSKGKSGLQLFGPDRAAGKSQLVAAGSATLDVHQVVEKVFNMLAKQVSSHLPKPSKKKSSSSKSGQQRGKPMVLTDANFDETVLQSDDAFMVAFVAPWCGHCQRLMPEYDQAALQLVDTGVVIATVDATANERLAQRYGIQGFPTIKFFGPGIQNKNEASIIDYQFERSASAIVTWSLQEFERLGGKITVEIPQIVSQDVFESTCEDDETKCVLVFLPDIYDTGASGRLELITAVEDAQRAARHVKFAWVQAGSQPSLEEAFQLGFGFPAAVYLRKFQGKSLAFVMRGTVSSSSLAAFASSAKKGPGYSGEQFPSVVDVEPWDGQDGAPIVEDDDDFDLDAFLNDD